MCCLNSPRRWAWRWGCQPHFIPKQICLKVPTPKVWRLAAFWVCDREKIDKQLRNENTVSLRTTRREDAIVYPPNIKMSVVGRNSQKFNSARKITGRRNVSGPLDLPGVILLGVLSSQLANVCSPTQSLSDSFPFSLPPSFLLTRILKKHTHSNLKIWLM